MPRCRSRPGREGDEFLNLRDAGDPVAVAARYEEEGADELVFLDITASHEGRDIMLDVVRRTAEQVFMPLTVGGGIRTIEDIRALLNAGSDKVSINSAACKDPQFVAEAAQRFGSQCIVVNIDPKRVRVQGSGSGEDRDRTGTEQGRRHADPRIPNLAEPERRSLARSTSTAAALPTGLEAVAWAKRVEELGAGEIVLTSMDCDGTKDGYDLEITRAVSEAVSIPVVASGGAGRPEHLADAILLGKARRRLGREHFSLRRVYDPANKRDHGRAGNPACGCEGKHSRRGRSSRAELARRSFAFSEKRKTGMSHGPMAIRQ